MDNKILIKIIIPETDDTYDIFIPVNEVVWKIKKMFVKGASDLSGNLLDKDADYCFINKDSGKIYNNNEVIIDTDIRNASELILLKINR